LSFHPTTVAPSIVKDGLLSNMMTLSKPINRGQRMKPYGRSTQQLANLAALISMFAAVLLTTSSNQSPAPYSAHANAPQSIPVTVSLAQQQDLPIYLNGLGSVTAFYTVNVKSRVDGQLVDVKFREGEFVKKGDLLAVIDPRPYQVQLDQAQAQLFRDQAS